jgi:hypothetical protein
MKYVRSAHWVKKAFATSEKNDDSKANPVTEWPLVRAISLPPVNIGRLIQMALALYLVPALLAVLVMSAVGMLVLTLGRVFAGPIQRSIGSSEP